MILTRDLLVGTWSPRQCSWWFDSFDSSSVLGSLVVELEAPRGTRYGELERKSPDKERSFYSKRKERIGNRSSETRSWPEAGSQTRSCLL